MSIIKYFRTKFRNSSVNPELKTTDIKVIGQDQNEMSSSKVEIEERVELISPCLESDNSVIREDERPFNETIIEHEELTDLIINEA